MAADAHPGAARPSRPALVLVLSLCALLGSCRYFERESVFVDPALVSLLPHDTVMLAGLRVKELRKTPVYGKLEAAGWLSALDSFANRTGLDVRENLWDLLIASNGRDTLWMARGKFSDQGLEPKLDLPGALRFEYRGYPFYGSPESAVTFTNSSTAIAGRTALLERILDNRDGPGSAPPQRLLDRTRQVPRAAQIWLVSEGWSEAVRQPMPRSGNLANLRRIYSSLDRIVLSIDLTDGLDLRAIGESPNPAEAAKLAGALGAMVGLGLMAAPKDDPTYAQALQAVAISQSEATVTLTLKLEPPVFEKLLTKLDPDAFQP